jgi:hypothetical protein
MVAKLSGQYVCEAGLTCTGLDRIENVVLHRLAVEDALELRCNVFLAYELIESSRSVLGSPYLLHRYSCIYATI